MEEDGYAHRCPQQLDELIHYPQPEGEDDIPVRTLYDNWRRARARFSRSPFLGTREFLRNGTRGEYIFRTYEEIGVKVDGLASGLIRLGVKPGDRVGTYSINREEVTVGDLACFCISCPTVSLYDTLGEDSIGYVLDHAEAVAVFCSRDKVKKVLSVANGCKSLRFVILYDDLAQKVTNDSYKQKEQQDAELQGLKKQLTQATVVEYEDLIKEGQKHPQQHVPPKPEDLVSILYTSGTTGVPKGVMLTHANMVASIAASRKAVQSGPDDVHLSYLPLAHIYERLVGASGLFGGGRCGYYQGDVKKLVEDIVALKPTIFCGVPRVYQKIYDKILQGVQASFWHRRQLFNYAYNTKVEARRQGLETPTLDKLVFSKIKERLGGRIRLMVSGSAPLSPTLHEFLEVVFCCPVLQGYGLSETSATGSVSTPDSRVYGHVGFPIASNEIKLVSIPEMNYLVTDKPHPRGEILIRGPSVFKGYYKMPEQTAEVFTQDGWFRTGDVGRWHADGTLAIIDRKKNIFKLSQGEYVAAEKLEGVFQRSKYIQQIFVYGDSFEDHLVAIVVPEPEFLGGWAAENLPKKEAEGGVAVLCKHPKVHQLIADELLFYAKDAQLKGFEYVHAFHLEPNEWTPETGMVTPTFKLKRPALKEQYAAILKKLYEEKKTEKEHKKAKL